MPFHHSPSTRAADISRLLDPSYSSNNNNIPSTAVYVDHHGDLHDPDYRHFPPVVKRAPLVSRPRWELADEDALDLQDGDDDIYSSHLSHNRRSSSHSRNRRHRDSSFSAYRPSYSPYYSPTEPSPPTSFESEDVVFEDEEAFSPFEEKRSVVVLKRKTIPLARVVKRPSSLIASTTKTTTATEEKRPTSFYPSSAPTPISAAYPTRSSFSSSRSHYPVPQEEDDDAEDEDDYANASGDQQEWTPTCSQAMRRQWQALALRFRFGVFRAQRKVKRRVGSLL